MPLFITSLRPISFAIVHPPSKLFAPIYALAQGLAIDLYAGVVAGVVAGELLDVVAGQVHHGRKAGTGNEPGTLTRDNR
jgi:hypothetical protein